MDQRELWSKIRHLTNGTDVNGVPLSSGMLAKDRIVAPDKTETVKNMRNSQSQTTVDIVSHLSQGSVHSMTSTKQSLLAGWTRVGL